MSDFVGNLKNYNSYQSEIGELLVFLKDLKQPKSIYLCEILNWNTPYPDTNYDIYIFGAFGEFPNTDLLDKIDNDANFTNKELIVLTSVYFSKEYKNIKCFFIEHLHTIVNLLDNQQVERKQLIARKYNHAALSRRNSFHKTYLIYNLQKYLNDVQYTLMNVSSVEFYEKTVNFKNEIETFLGIEISEEDSNVMFDMHKQTRSISGDQWDTNNDIYNESKLIWTPESIFLTTDNPTGYLTEKVFKSIISRSCFILVSQCDSYKRLKSLGFQTFEEQFNINFDSLEDCDRFDSMIQLMKSFDFNTMLNSKEVQEIVDYNYNYFINGFYNNVEEQNKPRIAEVIEYINAL